MSQLASFSRQVDALKLSIDKLLSVAVDSTNNASLAIHYTQLKQHLAQIENDLQITCDKLRQKLGQVDPVTGAKRYGAQAEQKFTTSANSLEEIYQLLRSHIQEHEEHYINAKKVVDEEREQQERAKAASIPVPVMSVVTVERFGADTASADDPFVSTSDNSELHQRAEELRLKKLQEMEELRSFEQKLDSLLNHSYRDYLNDTFLLADVSEVVNSIKTSSSFILSEWKGMRAILLDILGRIVSKPDDVNLRKLKATHPSIQSKITGRSGGIPLLLALGFQVVIKRERNSSIEVTSSTDSSGVSSDDLMHHPQRVQWLKQHKLDWEAEFFSPDSSSQNKSPLSFAQQVLDNYTRVFALCNHSPAVSPWDIYFEMEEPPVDELLLLAAPSSSAMTPDAAAGAASRPRAKLTWIDWYDRLQASIAALEKS